MTPSKKEAWDGGASEEVALLPCPFCRSTDVIVFDSDWHDKPSGLYWFGFCKGYRQGSDPCQAQGPCRDTESEAIAAWNRRALPDRTAVRDLIANMCIKWKCSPHNGYVIANRILALLEGK